MLMDLLSDIVKVDDVLMIVKSNGATIEMRSNSLSIRQKEKWITIGENDGPCHMHVNDEMIKNAEFVTEEKPERISFSVRFFDESNERVLACFFTKMYDESKTIKSERKKLYDNLQAKFGQKIQF
ncbi:hemin-degrading factor [Candidatus Nitrosopelagicus sp.]|nr:hemin-degrading factor [Candidatus Nitrosopelagicus sp.]MDC0241394.1 hemin-degrading factor [Candidatus Nitrosopelagicus sp.]